MCYKLSSRYQDPLDPKDWAEDYDAMCEYQRTPSVGTLQILNNFSQGLPYNVPIMLLVECIVEVIVEAPINSNVDGADTQVTTVTTAQVFQSGGSKMTWGCLRALFLLFMDNV